MIGNTNPGLLPFDISDYKGVRGKNFYLNDIILRDLTETEINETEHRLAVQQHLAGFGELTGGLLDELVEACHKEGKYGELVRFDRTGNRIDEIRYSYEQREVRRIAYEYGIVNLDFHPEWKFPFTMFHRMALAYLANLNGEAGYTCPLAMTDGMIRAIKALGTEEQKARYLPLIAGVGSSSHFMCGQYVTERVGGSNVAANRTIARNIGNGRWLLTGEKWFCSNPGDLWVTTARIEGTNVIGMFLVSRFRRDGSLNGCHLLRKKEIIGSRGKLTCEAVYEDCEAEELGRPGHGLVNLIKYVINTSRVHVAVAALGMGRRAVMEAVAYVSQREAYGQKVIMYPSVKKILSQMFVAQAAMTLVSFRNFFFSETGHAAAAVLTPLMKYISTTTATRICHEAMLLHGGNGILSDFSILPRLLNDSIINETWEGTHQIISEHVLSAWRRPKNRSALDTWLNEKLAQAPAALKSEVHSLRERIMADLREFEDAKSPACDEDRLFFCDRLYRLCAMAEVTDRLNLFSGTNRAAFYMALLRGVMELGRRDFHGRSERTGVFVPGEANSLLLHSILTEEL